MSGRTTPYQATYKCEKIQALALAKECYSLRLDLLTNAAVVDDAIRFVAQSYHKDKDESSKPRPPTTGSSTGIRTRNSFLV